MKHLLISLLFFLPSAAKAQERYTLKGVVSYYFNANYGDRPDTGAKAYILTEEDLVALGTSESQLYRYLIAYAKLGADPIDIEVALNSAKSEKAKKAMAQRLGDKPALLAKFKEVNDSTSDVMAKLDVLPVWQAKRVTADGGGVFTKKLAPGAYYVIVLSAHRKHNTTTELGGQYTLKKVLIKDDDLEIPIRFSI